jgi:hypothetical protein
VRLSPECWWPAWRWSARPATCSNGSQPEEYAFARSSKRAALAVPGVALIVLASRLFG